MEDEKKYQDQVQQEQEEDSTEIKKPLKLI